MERCAQPPKVSIPLTDTLGFRRWPDNPARNQWNRLVSAARVKLGATFDVMKLLVLNPGLLEAALPPRYRFQESRIRFLIRPGPLRLKFAPKPPSVPAV